MAAIAGSESPVGKLSLLLNNGSGGFAAQTPITIGQYATSVRFLHLNPGTGTGQDEHLDLAVTKTVLDGDPMETTSSVLTFLGDGSGGFGAPQTKPLARFGQAWFAAPGDMTEDGLGDLVVTQLPGAFSVLPSLGDGTLGPEIQTTGMFIPRSVAVADFDGDSHLDVVLTEDMEDVVRAFRGNGDGTFQAPRAFLSAAVPIRVIHGDWNGDDHPDLATLDAATGAVKAFLGNGQGDFSLSDTLTGTPTFALATADFDEDGHADLAWEDTALQRVMIARGNGNGTFATPSALTMPDNVYPYLLQAGLFTHGDSHADLALIAQAETGETVIRLFPGQGDGTFGNPKKKVTSASGDPGLAITAGDLDGDDWMDFAVALQSGAVQTVRTISADPGLSLGPSLQISQGTLPRSVLIADLDGDGDADIATASSCFTIGEQGFDLDPPPAGWISRFANTGNLTFAADDPIRVADYPTDLAFADLNGDGYADLSVVHLTNFNAAPQKVGVQVLISNGHGSYSVPDETPIGYAPFSLGVVDVNGDGLNDVVVADAAASQVTVLQNYLNVASETRAQPKVMFAKRRAPARPKTDGTLIASAQPPYLADIQMADFSPTHPNNSPYWYHNDHLGTPQVLTDQAGLVVWKGDYQPFGEVVTAEETVVSNFRFPGQYEDGESGQHFNWWRVYAAWAGRYLGADPYQVRTRGLFEPSYAYAYDSPGRLTDKSGLSVFICSRKAFTRFGPGNHGYVCDGKGTNCGRNQLVGASESGSGDPHGKENCINGDACVRVPGSDGLESTILAECCSSKMNTGAYVPFVNDCQNAVEDCLARAGFRNPGIPGGRIGPPCDQPWGLSCE